MAVLKVVELWLGPLLLAVDAVVIVGVADVVARTDVMCRTNYVHRNLTWFGIRPHKFVGLNPNLR